MPKMSEADKFKEHATTFRQFLTELIGKKGVMIHLDVDGENKTQDGGIRFVGEDFVIIKNLVSDSYDSLVDEDEDYGYIVVPLNKIWVTVDY